MDVMSALIWYKNNLNTQARLITQQSWKTTFNQLKDPISQDIKLPITLLDILSRSML